MSLTSYRAAPPRVNLCTWALGSSPRVTFDLRFASLTGSLVSYEPDELPGCSTPRYWFASWIPGSSPGMTKSLCKYEEVFEDLAPPYSPMP